MSGPDERLVAELAAALDPQDVRGYAQFALRTRSPLAREVLRAAGETGALGRVTALLGEPGAHRRGLSALDETVRRTGARELSPEVLATWADLLLRSGRDEELRELLDDPDLELTHDERWRLRTDLLNPYRTSWQTGGGAQEPGPRLEAAEREWLLVFNEIHADAGLEPLRLLPAEAGDAPYRRLEAPVQDPVDGELVTVVMSAYQPDRDLILAVRGVIQQTWRNLELLIVDDASPPGSQEVLAEAEAMDPRVRVVRAPRNRGTYAARNLALSIAQGRWMTFQDSDDWTHPRRVEHQVRHLQEHPKVLANRTWTLRAYPDLTLTFVGYPAARLNASSFLFDRLQVTRLIGGFDPTRKAADSELPLRLQAVRRGSVQDLRHPSPLAITQLRANSLSRSDSLPGWMRWDRLAYRDSYREWHRQIRNGRATPFAVAEPASGTKGGGRPFPLPRQSWEPDRDPSAGPVTWDVVVLGDLRWKGAEARRVLGVARTSAHSGLRTAVAHAEAPYPISGMMPALLPTLALDVRLGRLGQTNTDEGDACDLLIVAEPASLLHVDHAALTARDVLVVADGPTPDGWSVAAVDHRCRELFGVAPRWGGPTSVHEGPEGRSAVRLAVSDERWCAADLATVAGEGWQLVGDAPPRPLPRRRPGPAQSSPIVVGHHLADGPRRWPASAEHLAAAYPRELTLPDPTGDAGATTTPVELHGLQGLRTPVAVTEHSMRPPSWVSFAGTGMSVREFLSHLDVWVYFGEWDTAAEVSALEALGAGLPCVLGEDAAASGLAGPVRCVAPAGAGEAIAELLTQGAEEVHSSATRQAEWARVLRRLVTTPAGPDDAVAAHHEHHHVPGVCPDRSRASTAS